MVSVQCMYQQIVGMCAGILFRKGLVQQPDDDGQVLALIEGGEKHRVLVLDGHCCCCCCEGGNGQWMG